MVTRDYYLDKVKTVIGNITPRICDNLMSVEVSDGEIGYHIDNIKKSSSFTSMVELGVMVFSSYYASVRIFDQECVANIHHNILFSISTTVILTHISNSIHINAESVFVNYIYLLVLTYPESYTLILRLIEAR